MRTKAEFHEDLMVTSDDAGSIHWRKAGCCDVGSLDDRCYPFFAVHTPRWLYPPWRELYEAAP